MKKIALALSGGIDSSVCAYFLREQGYDVHCFTMRLFDDQELGFTGDSGCTGTIKKAKAVAEKLGLPFHIIDLRPEFKEKVLSVFLKKYQLGFTPNPCVDCNFQIKWGVFVQKLLEKGFSKVASGHYAQVVIKDGKHYIYKAKDDSKDQTYFFWRLLPNQLEKMFFPLAQMEKAKIKAIALELGLVESSKESQGVCFIENDYKELLCRLIGNYPGAVRLHGKKIGEHRGIAYYTIGQRRGLEIPYATPLYVKSKDAKSNSITVVEDRKQLESSVFYIKNVNFFVENFEKLKGLSVQTCYHTAPVPVTSVTALSKGYLVETQIPVNSIAPGQSAVFYNDDLLVGGGELG